MGTSDCQIFVAGDSTAAEKRPEKRPESGWAEHLQPYLREGAVVCNHAVNGRSTKSFLDEGRLAKISEELRPGDYLLIQFGHNDEKMQDPARYTDPFGQYQENLRLFFSTARDKGATPVLLTSMTRRKFEGGVLFADTVGAYPAAAKQVAAAEGVALLDLYAASWQYLSDLGEAASAALFLQLAPGENENYPEGVVDNTHFNLYGAKQMAALVVQALRESSCRLKEWLR